MAGRDAMIAALGAVAAAMDENRDALCALDGAIGDGDHGVAMALGFGAVREALAGLGAEATPADVLNAAARAFLGSVGASCGPLYATAMMRAAAAVRGKPALGPGDMAPLIAGMAEGIAHRGKAAPGDKTMLDAWAPAAAAAAEAPQGEAWAAALAAARTGAEATAGMEARLGRAARLGARSLGHKDPGAASAVMVIGAMAGVLGRV